MMPNMIRSQMNLLAVSVVGISILLMGCGRGPTAVKQPDDQKVISTSADVVRVLSSTYDAGTRTVNLQVSKEPNPKATSRTGMTTSEDLLDISDGSGIANYATCLYPNKAVNQVHISMAGTTVPASPIAGLSAGATSTNQYVVTDHGWVSYHSAPRLNSSVVGRLQVGDKAPLVRTVNRWWYEIHVNNRNVYITTNTRMTRVVTGSTATVKRTVNVPRTISQPVTATATTTSSRGTSIHLPPPGVQMDTLIRAQAGLNASAAQKTNAVLSVARSKLGTPYIWGHNEDRGQYGFDCSNYTEYVYHHALGYRFTTSSRGQYRSVGVNIARSQMQPGDLLIFNSGGHVGIYAGNNQMIQEGGGLAKVGYLSLRPGGYWANHLSAVRRMY